MGVKKMIEVPIAVDADSNKVYANIIELDPIFGPINNKKLAVIQTEIIKEARKNLEKQKGSEVF